MEKSYIALLLLAIAGAVILYGGYETKSNTHHLISRIESQAFIAFNEWLEKSGKQYREVEEKSYRFRKFLENYKVIREHNERYARGQETYDLAINKFADLDNIQFRALFTGYKKHRGEKSQIKLLGKTEECKGKIEVLQNLPTQVSWKDKAVASVKNQGMCGSCWAFSACGAVEGLDAIESKNAPRTFSPQQLVDCASGYSDNQGCNGGEMDAALWYFIDNGVALESKYPYKAKTNKCAYDAKKMKAYQINGCAQVLPANKTKVLMSAVAKQPVSIAVQADTLQFQFYSKGVFSGKCGTDLDHGIVLTGYGNLSGKDYWECKNSWGADWGVSGYIMIAKSDDDGPGQCGIMMENVVPQN